MVRSSLDMAGKGPLLGSSRRRALGSSHALLWLAAFVGGGYWAATVIGRDLGAATHLNASHAQTDKQPLPPHAVATTQPTAVAAAPVQPLPPLKRVVVAPDPVQQALLAAARDHLARKVTPTSYSIEDIRADAGNHLDLIERGLHGFVPLRTAVARHRMRAPAAYGLAGRPVASPQERKRAWTVANVHVFLRTYAEPVAGTATLEGGDIVVLQRLHGGTQPLLAVVSDIADAAGLPQVVVMDPTARTPREVSLAGHYRLVGQFRMHAGRVAQIRQALDLEAPQGAPL